VWVGHEVEQFPIENQPCAILGLATREPNVKTEKCNNSLNTDFFMVGTSSKGTSYVPRVFDLNYFSRSQRSKLVHAHLDDAYAINI
jgi:hypothetical protein